MGGNERQNFAAGHSPNVVLRAFVPHFEQSATAARRGRRAFPRSQQPTSKPDHAAATNSTAKLLRHPIADLLRLPEKPRSLGGIVIVAHPALDCGADVETERCRARAVGADRWWFTKTHCTVRGDLRAEDWAIPVVRAILEPRQPRRRPLREMRRIVAPPKLS